MSMLIPQKSPGSDPELEKELEYLYLRKSLVENLIRHLEEYTTPKPASMLKPKKVA